MFHPPRFHGKANVIRVTRETKFRQSEDKKFHKNSPSNNRVIWEQRKRMRTHINKSLSI